MATSIHTLIDVHRYLLMANGTIQPTQSQNLAALKAVSGLSGNINDTVPTTKRQNIWYTLGLIICLKSKLMDYPLFRINLSQSQQTKDSLFRVSPWKPPLNREMPLSKSYQETNVKHITICTHGCIEWYFYTDRQWVKQDLAVRRATLCVRNRKGQIPYSYWSYKLNIHVNGCGYVDTWIWYAYKQLGTIVIQPYLPFEIVLLTASVIPRRQDNVNRTYRPP